MGSEIRIWRGNYNFYEQYREGDVVYDPYSGFTYICIRDTYGLPPYVAESGFEVFAGSYLDISVLDGGEF